MDLVPQVNSLIIYLSILAFLFVKVIFFSKTTKLFTPIPASGPSTVIDLITTL